MKHIIIAIFLFLLKVNFLSGNENPVFEVENDSTLKFYYDGYGILTNKSAAQFFRIISIKSIENSLTGEVRDYYISGKVVLSGQVKNGLLNDSATFYYENGLVKEAGRYLEGHRVALWKFYYPEGALKKVIEFTEVPLIHEFYSKSGKAQILNGKGRYKDNYLVNYRKIEYFDISGTVKKGLMEDKWELTYSTTIAAPIGQTNFNNICSDRQHNLNYIYSDIFHNGIFKAGQGQFDYTVYSHGIIYSSFKSVNQKHSNPVVKLTDFCPQEIVNIYTSVTSPKGDVLENNEVLTVPIKTAIPLKKFKIKGPVCYEYSDLQLPYYDANQNLNVSFVPVFEKIINSRIDTILNAILLIQFRISRDSQIDSVVIYSNNKDLTKYIPFIISDLKSTSKKWTPVRKKDSNESFDSYLYIPLIVNHNKIQIGDFYFRTEYLSTDISDLIEF